MIHWKKLIFFFGGGGGGGFSFKNKGGEKKQGWGEKIYWGV